MSSESKKEGLKILLFMDLIFKTLAFVEDVSNISLMRTLVIGDLDSLPPAVSIKLLFVSGIVGLPLTLGLIVGSLDSILPAVSIKLTWEFRFGWFVLKLKLLFSVLDLGSLPPAVSINLTLVWGS